MSLAIRPPRRSALGVTWCEDFSRGRLGVRRNGGTIVETPPDVVGFRGKWATFPESTAAAVQYPDYRIVGATAITFGCWYRNLVAQSGTYATLVGQYDTSAGSPAGRSYALRFRNNLDFYIFTSISGALRSANGTIVAADQAGPHMVVGRWSTGNDLEIFFDGAPFANAGPYVGSIDDYGSPLTVGRDANADGELNGWVADPLVLIGRAMSDDEILNLYRRSLFH